MGATSADLLVEYPTGHNTFYLVHRLSDDVTECQTAIFDLDRRS